MSARREHGQKLADQADEELPKGEKAMSELQAQQAAAALASAKKLLSEPDAQLYPEHEMLTGRLKEDEAKPPDRRRARELRDLHLALTRRKEKIDERHAGLKKALKALEVPAVEKGAVYDAASAASDLLEAIKDGAELEPKDKAYAEYAKAK